MNNGGSDIHRGGSDMRLRFKSAKGTAFSVVICIIVALIVPMLGQAAFAGHPDGSCLDVTPETDENVAGDTHTLTATLRQPKTDPLEMPLGEVSSTCDEDATAPLPLGGGSPDTANAQTETAIIDFEITGPSDPDGGNTPDTPDRTCTIQAGASSCDTGYTGTAAGLDTICAWIDEDGSDGTTEGDCGPSGQEPRDQETPGTAPGPGATDLDDTDTVEKTWRAAAPAKLDCDDASGDDRETNPGSGTQSQTAEVYTCRLTDQFGNPTNDADPNTGGTQSVTIYGENKNGPNDPDNAENYTSGDHSCSPDTNGQCSITVPQSEGQNGTAPICFWGQTTSASQATEGNALCGGANEPTDETENNDLADQVEKTWEARRAAQVDAEPESSTNTLGQTHTITAAVFDQFDQTMAAGTQVGFEILSGSPGNKDGNSTPPPDLSCTTNSSGQCSVSYSHTGTAGTDTICVYIDQDGQTTNGLTGPTTSGATCDGEGVTATGDDAGFDTQTQQSPTAQQDVDVVQKVWQPSSAPSQLDCTPENDSNPPGTSHTITCTTRNTQTTTANTNVDVEATGASDPDGGDSRTTPDFTCTTNSSGTCTFTHTSAQTATGTTTYRAWIDSDNISATPEGDPNEQTSETGAGAGDRAEPDDTDVVEKLWTAGPRVIDCTPETATNEAGTTHDIVCNVKDRGGSNVPNQTVTATSSGTGSFQGGGTTQTKNTDGAGNVTFTVTTTRQESGLQTVTASLPTTASADECEKAAGDPQGSPQGVCSDTVNKTWTAFTPTTPPDGFPRTVTLEASKNRVKYGRQVTLTATVSAGSADTPASCVQNVPVELERVVAGTTTSVLVQTVTTDSSGVASFTVVGDKSASYIAHLDQTSQCSQANSAPEDVLVKKAVGLRLSDSRVDKGDRIRLRVKVRPCGPPDGQGHPRDRVVLYKRINGTMAKIDKARTNRKCVAVFRQRIRKNSVFQARSPKQDADHLGGKSRKKAVRVR